MSRVAGVVAFTWNGVAYQVIDECQYQPSKSKLEAQVGYDGYHGDKETPQACWIKLKLRDSGSYRVQDLHAQRGGTAQAQLANGKLVIGRGMTCNISEGVDGLEATYEAEFFGAQVLEVPAPAS